MPSHLPLNVFFIADRDSLPTLYYGNQSSASRVASRLEMPQQVLPDFTDSRAIYDHASQKQTKKKGETV